MDGAFFLTQYTPAPHLPAEERVRNFEQVLRSFSKKEASIQGGRCAGCDTPGCNTGCPVGQDIPGFNLAIENNDWLRAHQIAVRSPLYGLFGRICPQQEGLCESHCTVGYLSRFGLPKEKLEPLAQQKLSDTITIGANETAIWDSAIAEGWLKYATPKTESSQSVVVIGAGPAGIYLALDQRRAGRQVTVYDAWDEIGGLLLKGIPDFKMAKKDLPAVRKAMEQAGVKFELKAKIGNGADCKFTFQHLLDNHDIIVIATGTYAARRIANPLTGLPINGHEHVIQGLDYLFAHNDHVRFQTPVPVHLQVKGKRVIVVGPGDTGQDCIRTALRAGAAQVSVLHRSIKLRGALKERLAAREEADMLQTMGLRSMDYTFQVLPTEVTRASTGELHLTMQKTDGATETIVADMVINATGFNKEEHADRFGIESLTLNANGTTSLPNVFVAGDALTGATLAVTAARNAWDVSRRVHDCFRLPATIPAINL